MQELSNCQTKSLLNPVVSRLLEELKARLAEVYRDRLRGVILYGSYAKGTARKDSDLDVAMILEEAEGAWPEIDRTGPLVAALSLKYGVTVSLLPVHLADWDQSRTLLARTLHREGVLVA